MTDDETIALGTYCGDLLANEQFSTLVNQFEQQIVQHMLSTEPHEQKKREGIYASFLGLKDFLGHMRAIISDQNRIEEAQKPAPSEFDALTQDFND